MPKDITVKRTDFNGSPVGVNGAYSDIPRDTVFTASDAVAEVLDNARVPYVVNNPYLPRSGRIEITDTAKNPGSYVNIIINGTQLKRQVGVHYVPIDGEIEALTNAGIEFTYGRPSRGMQLLLNMLASTVLDPRITFTRTGGTATRINASGLLETVAADTPRFDFDPISKLPLGLLIEEARTNRCLQSNSLNTSPWGGGGVTVTAGAATGPDGAASMALLTPTSNGAGRSQNVTFVGDGTKAVSLWIKAGTAPISQISLRDGTAAVNRGRVTIAWAQGVPSGSADAGTLLGIDPFPNGLYRVRLQCPGVVAANTNTINIFADRDLQATMYAGFVQAEDATYPTSYIASVASAVTRNTDQAVMSGSNFSSWFNVLEGTINVDFDANRLGAETPTAVSISDNTNANRISIWGNGAAMRNFVNAASSTQAVIDVGTFTPGANMKAALAYKLNDFNAAANGVLGAADTSGTIPVVDRMYIGGGSTGGASLNGHIRSLTYYNTRLPDQQIKIATAA